MDNLLNIKKYNLMNFDIPHGFTITLGFNGLNFILGIISADEFNMLVALVGLTMNLILFLVKMYQMLYKIVSGKDNNTDDFDHDTLKRPCPNCKNVYETTSPTQIFCTPECRQIFNADAYSRRP